MNLHNLAIKIDNQKEWYEIQKILLSNKFIWKSGSRSVEYAPEEFFIGEIWIMTSYNSWKSICHSHYAFNGFTEINASKLLEKYTRYKKLIKLRYENQQ